VQAQPDVAVVVGASGGIGAALTARLAADPAYGRVLALSRAPSGPWPAHVTHEFLELADERTIAGAAALAATLGRVRLVICATGLLHAARLTPEKHWGALEPEALARAFAVNATGPALVAKHFLPLLPRELPSVFAALTARVGSIEDNRSGGWYAYRASKAALNMLLRTFAIELARRAPQAICVGLHPGTVDTTLSKPFQAAVPAGQLFSADTAAGHLLGVIARLTPADSGRVFAWDARPVPA
jgi:NAD(P)-dependent dehydrogenase (short-subunit alcohol dehydrogenase family)